MRIRLFTTFILSITFITCFGQFFDESQSPLSVKWRLIQHQGFKIIYPSELEKDAQRMSNTFSSIYPTLGRDLKQQKTITPIILQNRGTTSNGFVQLAPKKSEFYTISPQTFDSQDWLNNLAVHELRHVLQYTKYTGKIGHPFPEEIYFAYLGASTPIWFLEGDAVVTETKHTYAGRGRQPSWIMPFRTTLLADQKISYSKAYFGSEKNLAPGYYQLGYLMTTHLKKNYGEEITNDIISDITKRPLRLHPFSSTLKRLTGMNTKKYFEQLKLRLKSDWIAQAGRSNFEDYKPLNKTANFVTNYYLPTQLQNGQILALKNSKAEAAKLVILDSSKSEQTVTKIAYQEMPWFSYGSGKIVWDELRQDARYKKQSWNVICLYDLITKTRKQLTFKSRLFAPSISADGKKIVAVKVDLSNRHQLVFINPENGEILDSLPNPSNLQLQTPALNFDGSELAWISVNEDGKSLWIKKGDSTTALITNSRQQLSRPMFFADKIAFNAHYNGIDNIYEVDLATRKIMALTAAKYGAFNASISADNKTLVFNNFGVQGYDIAITPIERNEVGQNNFVQYTPTTKAEDYVFANIPDSTFESKPYRPLAHIFNLHSLSPTVNDAQDQIGLQLKSDDLLNTASFYAGATYLSSLKNIEYNAGFKFKALYPVFNATFRNRPRLANYRFQNQIQQAKWRENVYQLTANLPLSVNKFNHNYSFNAEIGTYYVDRHLTGVHAQRLANSIKFPLTYRLSFNHNVRSAERDIAPPWSQLVQLKLQHFPFEDNFNGKLFAIESYWYFPGLAKNHTFLASFNYQQNSGTFRANNEIGEVYGYNQILARSLVKNTLLLNYRFPFLYPDLEIGPFAYIRNVSATLFSHYENIGHETKLSQPKTYGFELRSEMNLLRYQPISEIGARFIFVNKIYNQNPIFELLFNYYF